MALANRSLERGLAILDCFKPGIGVLAHRDLVERTGLPKATVTRLVRTLLEQGYLVFDAGRAGYRLGVPILSLSRSLILQHEVLTAVSPVIRHVATRMGAMVGFGTAHGSDIVYLDGVNRDASRPGRRIGRGMRIPIIGSSIGHAWLAGLQTSERVTALARLRREAPGWQAGSRAAVDRAVRQFREVGHCAVTYNEGRHLAIGAPVHVEGIVHAFNVVAPIEPGKLTDVPEALIEGLDELVASVRQPDL